MNRETETVTGKTKGRGWLLASVIVPLCFLALIRLNLPDMTETCNDVYWHVAAAARPLPEIIAKKFPITLSVWRDHYADKELTFHLLLKVYTTFKHMISSPLRPPFHLPSLAFAALFLTSFVIAGRALKIRPVILFFSSLLLAGISSAFTVRVLMLRPHIFSMSLMLLAYAVLSAGPEKRSAAWKIFLLSFLYAWSYSSPHLVWITCFVFSAVYAREYGWKAFLSSGASLLGLLAGYCIHPQFPNTFLVWKIQGIDALLAPLRGGTEPLPFAAELLPPPLTLLLRSIPVLILLYLTAMLYFRTREKKIRLSPAVRSIFFLTVLWNGAMLTVSARPPEYAVPLTVLAFALLAETGKQHGLFRFCDSDRKILILLGVFAFITGGITFTMLRDRYRHEIPLAPIRLFRQAEKVIPAGSRVVNVVWSDFPPCFFAASRYEYAWGLDPMFSFVPFPEKTAALGQIAFRNKAVDPQNIGNMLQADYAVILAKHAGLAEFLTRCGWKVLCRSGEGWIFSLNTRTGRKDSLFP